MTPQQWARCARVAFEGHDSDAFDRAIAELLHPTMRDCNRAQLLERRVDLCVQFADLADRLAAMDGAGRASALIAPLLHQPPAGGTLDPSDPEAL